jgi:hypothetical protein
MKVEYIFLSLIIFFLVLTNGLIHKYIENQPEMLNAHIINSLGLISNTILIYTCTNIPKYYSKK